MFESLTEEEKAEIKDEKSLENSRAIIKVIGVGGGGSNAVNKMIESNIENVEFYVANTDSQALKDSMVENKLFLGKNLTKGLGAGANPEIGKSAAKESLEELKKIVSGTDLVFVTAGLGGGTGSGAGPIIAKAIKNLGILVVSIVTTPFSFEGKKRTENAKFALREIKKNSDSVIVVSNNRLLAELGNAPLTDSFQYSDAILKQAVRTIADLVNKHSLINLDFADIRTVIENQGYSLIGTGRSSGENAAVDAAIKAINSPILDSSIEGAKNAIVNVLGGPNALTIEQAQEAVQTIKEAANSDVDIIFGVTINNDLGEEIIVSVIATGLKYIRNFDGSNSIIEQVKYIFGDDTNIDFYRTEDTKEEIVSDEKTEEKTEEKTTTLLVKSLSLLNEVITDPEEIE